MSRVRRETDLEWLDAIPSNWSEREIGREVWVRARLGWKGLTADEYVDAGIPMLATPDIKGPEIAYRAANKIAAERYEESPEIKLRSGDVLLTKDGNTIGTVNVVRDLPGPATVNGSIAVLTPTQELDGRFLYWFIASSYAQSIFDRLRGGMGVPHLFQRDINRIRFPYPPLPEQRAIADYLDRETARIDTLIEEQQRLIEMLRERRDSAWAARVETAGRLGRLMSIRRVIESIADGPFGSSLTSAHYSGEGARVIRLGNIGVDEFRDSDAAFIPLDYANELNAHAVEEGDVVVAGLGDEKMPLGRAAVVPALGPAIVKADCYRLRPNTHVSAEYLAWVLSAPQTRSQIMLLARGSTRARLNTKVMQQVEVPLPDRDTQNELVAQSHTETAKTDSLIAETERFIALARERRAALITAAVTGQVDVQAVA